MSGFNEVVAEWLRSSGGDVAEVISVETMGDDWCGDTEGGFYSESRLWIKFTRANGSETSTQVAGSEIAELWDHVMKSWPA